MTPLPNTPRSRRTWLARLTLAAATAAAVYAVVLPAPAQQPLTDVVREVNKKTVKLYGAGGFKGLPSYGTGILISPDGWILTANSHILNTADLRVHLYDGRIYIANVVYKEPELDLALLKIEERDGKVDKLPYFNFAKAAAAPVAEPGTWVLAFSNQFNIATRDEPMSVQKGVIQAHTALHGRKGIFRAPFEGEVYFLDQITNNPGAAGGPITNTRGELLGIIGRELKNTLSDTWINYALPVQAKVEARRDESEKVVTVTLDEFVRDGMARKWKTLLRPPGRQIANGYTGIILVPNAVTVTPPYIEEVVPGSPAAKAGLRPDDLIVYIEGELVPSIRQYRELIKYAQPGQDLTLEIQRGSKLQTVKLKVDPQPKGVKAP
jgi:serine protease Do